MNDQEFFSIYGGNNPAQTYSAANLANNTTPIPNAVAQAPTGNNIFGMSDDTMLSLFGGTNAEGVTSGGALNAAAGIGSALAQSWLGFQQYGLARDMFSFQKDAFNKNFAMQKDSYDTAKANQTNTANKQNA